MDRRKQHTVLNIAKSMERHVIAVCASLQGLFDIYCAAQVIKQSYLVSNHKSFWYKILITFSWGHPLHTLR